MIFMTATAAWLAFTVKSVTIWVPAANPSEELA
jgi:hypothetical protein